MVLSPRSLSYARVALESLLRQSIEPLDLRLITDSTDDQTQLADTLAELRPEDRHRWGVTCEQELNDAEATRFRGLPHLRAFRHGHPCWRKVTDPLLLSEPGEELVLLDPDLYFPNRFHFEQTPAAGLLLMWQRPNCLLPPEVVRTAFAAGIPLARHVDIGISHWRAGFDLEWLDAMLGKLSGGGVASLPRAMHVEAIVWSAIAMHGGGGYLDPARWVCWFRSQGKRVQRKLGTPTSRLLASEPWDAMACFHAGGEAKSWIPEFVQTLPPSSAVVAPGSPPRPFLPLTAARYEVEQRAKDVLRLAGYYKVFQARHA